MNRLFFILALVIFTHTTAISQKISWSTRLMDYSHKFQSDNNFAYMAMGVPSVYPDTNYYNPYSQYCEGYILEFKNTDKKNLIKVGFHEPIMAQQLILGGIFNPGSILSIDVVLEDEKTRKNVYTFNQKYSIVKLINFHVFFQPTKVSHIEIVFQHKFINKWNLLKGIGLSYNPEPEEVLPYQIDLTNKVIKKELVDDNIKTDDCFLFAPKISADGNTLFFVKECANNKNGQDIWTSTKEDGLWSEPVNVGKPLNNASHNYVASVGADGNTLLVGNKYGPDGNYAGDGISKSIKMDDGKWSLPQAISIPNNINYNENVNYFQSLDEKYIIIASEDDISLGDLDLSVSIFNSLTNKWSAPIHLGATINTPHSEDYPYLAKDGITLYYSSKGFIGYGGHDIYMSKRLDDTWKNWSKPVNLGPKINTSADDKGFIVSADGAHAYLNSTSFDTANKIDIYKIVLPEEFHQLDVNNIVKVSTLKSKNMIDLK